MEDGRAIERPGHPLCGLDHGTLLLEAFDEVVGLANEACIAKPARDCDRLLEIGARVVQGRVTRIERSLEITTFSRFQEDVGTIEVGEVGRHWISCRRRNSHLTIERGCGGSQIQLRQLDDAEHVERPRQHVVVAARFGQAHGSSRVGCRLSEVAAGAR